MNEKVLSTWIDFVLEEDLEKQKISFSQIHNHQFFSIKSSLRQDDGEGVILEIPEDTIELLKKNYPLKKNKDEEDPQLFFVFPLIKGREKKMNEFVDFFTPLFQFQIDLEKLYSDSTIFISPHDSTLITPREDILSNALGIEDDVFAMNLSFTELVNRITGKEGRTFKQLFYDLKSFIKSNLNEQYTELNHQAAIVPMNQASRLAKDLVNEFKEMKGLEIENYSPLLNRYLQGVSSYDEEKAKPHPEKIWYGSFGDYPMGIGQAAVLQKIQDGEDLLSVQGPPGTGKTTLFLSVIANQIVLRALAKIKGEDFNNLMVIVSSTNKAVDNVSERFSAGDEFKDLNWLYFIAGNQNKIKDSLPRIERLINEIQEKEFSKDEQKNLEASILNIVKEFEEEKYTYLKIKDNLSKQLQSMNCTDLNQLEDRYKENIDKLADFDVVESSMTNFIEEISYKITETEIKEEEIKSVRKSLKKLESERPGCLKDQAMFTWLYSEASQELSKKNIPSLILYLLSKAKRDSVKGFIRVYDEEFKKCEIIKTGVSNLKHLSSFAKSAYSIENWSSIKECCKEKTFKENLQHIDSIIKIFNDQRTILISVKSFINDYSKAKSLESELNRYGENFFEYFRTQKVAENKRLYELSLKYNYLEMVRRKDDITSALEDWKSEFNGYNKDSFRRRVNNMGEYASLISLAYPVITTTLISVKNLFPPYHMKHFKEHKPINMCLSDESGMIPVHTFPPVLYRSNKAIVVGDPKQLEPIVTINQSTVDRIEEKHFGSMSETFERYDASTVSAYHRASLCKTGSFNDVGDGILLDEHRRCQSNIADLFSDIADYKGMKTRTNPVNLESRVGKAFEKMGCLQLMFYGVEGRNGYQANTNTDEINAIGLVLDKLENSGFDLEKDVGIITPYRNQSYLLKKHFSKRLGHINGKQDKIGTVHSFQGVEFEVILFSPVIFSPQQSSMFLNRKPNFMNVAISRAKLMFITVGNFHKLKSSGGYLKKLCDKIPQEALILMEENGPHTKEIHERINGNSELLHDCAHINYFEDTLNSAEKEVTIITPWIRSFKNSNPQYDAIEEAVNNGKKVKLFYGYNNEGATTNDDGDTDLIKKYKDLLGEDMIRLKEGTHEKIIIKDDNEAAVGSWNWLSHNYYQMCKNKNKDLTIRRETSLVINDGETIKSLFQRIM